MRQEEVFELLHINLSANEKLFIWFPSQTLRLYGLGARYGQPVGSGTMKGGVKGESLWCNLESGMSINTGRTQRAFWGAGE